MNISTFIKNLLYTMIYITIILIEIVWNIKIARIHS